MIRPYHGALTGTGGFGNSEFMQNINQEGAARTGLGLALNPRFGKGSEIAAVAVFLASDDAGYINGQCIQVDGGWTAYM